jgi:hypothetical protein
MSVRSNPLNGALSPEDVPSLLRTFPDASKVKRVLLLNETSEPYSVEKYITRPIDSTDSAPLRLNFSATATRSEGLITFFRSPGLYVDRAVTIAKHEQVHLNHDPAYRIARRLDHRVEATHYGYTNVRESEAELESTAFLTGSVPRFFAALEKAPLRMSLLANKLTKTIAAAPDGALPVDAEQILARARYIQENVLPRQSNRISKLISSGKVKYPADMNLLLDGLKN